MYYLNTDTTLPKLTSLSLSLSSALKFLYNFGSIESFFSHIRAGKLQPNKAIF